MPSLRTTAALLALLFAGCDRREDGTPPEADADTDADADSGADTGSADADADGWTNAAGDCDDVDPAVHPGAEEAVADGIDQDCDGTERCYIDDDHDGYGRSSVLSSTELDCSFLVMALEGADCDDRDPRVSPGATESCNGVDDDCDGVVDDGVPCEDCANGLDDDKDGLVDCEDGDCTGADPCEETACTNGLDDDVDGLADCDDEDCWGSSCHPAGVRSRVWSGTFGQTFGRNRFGAHGSDVSPNGGWCTFCTFQRDIVGLDAHLRSVRGTVQVLPPGIPSWDATAARTTCSWSIASAWAVFGYSRTVGGCSHGHGWSGTARPDAWVLAPVRAGLHVDPGCRLQATSWFLPELVTRNLFEGSGVGTVVYNMTAYGGWFADWGPRWYVGVPVPGSSVRASVRGTTPGTTYCPGVDDWGVIDTNRTWAGLLSPGSVYTALP